MELIVEDDRQDSATAKQAVGRLIARKVDAIIGPMTSAVAVATVPLVNEARVTMISPTVTTSKLSGIDDYFLRVIAPTTDYARKGARYHYANQGHRRIAAAYDLRNSAYSENWLADIAVPLSPSAAKSSPPRRTRRVMSSTSCTWRNAC